MKPSVLIVWQEKTSPEWSTHKELEMHGCVVSIIAADALVLKHQAISNHSACISYRNINS